MSYLEIVRNLSADPEGLERVYGQAVRSGAEAEFAEALEGHYAQAGDNLLLAAWHYRLAYAAKQAKGRVIQWGWALPVGLLNGLLLWLLSDTERFAIEINNPITGQPHYLFPAVLLLLGPLTAAALSLFLTLAGNRQWPTALAAVLGMAAALGYALLTVGQVLPRAFQEQYLGLMALHLALLGWAAVGLVALGRSRDASNRFAFLFKSLEAFVVAGLLGAAWGLFTLITFGLFAALGIIPSMVTQRLFVAGGGGLIAVIAVALVYDPKARPVDQPFDEGLSKLVALLLRLLLPLAVIMLAVYLAFIPFNWREPFDNRSILVAFNALLFAVIGLLLGATPVREDDLSVRGQRWLRRGIIALAALALIISLYAMAAIVYRTLNDRLTPNRLVFVGWNIVNIVILAALLIGQARTERVHWISALHRAFARGALLYVGWALVALLALPWLFRGDIAAVKELPLRVQEIVWEYPPPVLLKCERSPHVYLLEGNEKRWVKDIPTFTAEGFTWDMVQEVSCGEIE
ncbi:MAG: hypothetical protein MUC34_08025, partial [Anaerolineae bacterium]|nr:hypothetical protein [Anaerolineae bacterium]